MPALEIICVVGAGFEGVDLAAARERGIVVTYGAGVNAATWPSRRGRCCWPPCAACPGATAACAKAAGTRRARSMPTITGQKLGIFGLGHIGKADGEARRARLRHGSGLLQPQAPRTDVDYRYFDRLPDLAAWCDVLMVAAPGGPATLSRGEPRGPARARSRRVSRQRRARHHRRLRTRSSRRCARSASPAPGSTSSKASPPSRRHFAGPTARGVVAARRRVLARGDPIDDPQGARQPRCAFRGQAGAVPDSRVDAARAMHDHWEKRRCP